MKLIKKTNKRFGGGTSVTAGVCCPARARDARCMVSLDLRRMAAVKWLDRDNMLARPQRRRN